MSSQDMIRALLEERAGLARQGLADRVAQVDAELSRLGHAQEPREATVEPKRTASRRKVEKRA